MKKRDIVVTSAVYLVFTLLSCGFAGIFSAMVVRFANKFAELSFIANAGVRTVALVLFAAFFQANDRRLELDKNKNAEKYILFSKNSLKIFFQRGIF